jgi:hypothetical protein
MQVGYQICKEVNILLIIHKYCVENMLIIWYYFIGNVTGKVTGNVTCTIKFIKRNRF